MSFFLHRLYFVIENLLARSTAYQLLLVVIAVMAISVTGGSIVFFFGTGFEAYPTAVWWAFLRLTDPGYLGDDAGAVNRVVSTTLTVAGYVVFLGALVAIMTNWLNRFLSYLSSGHSPIFEEDHLLVLGWNDRMPILVEEMIHSKERIKRSHRLSRFPAIVILTADYRPNLLQEVRSRVRNIGRYRRLFIRAGNPLEFESLRRVAFLRASCILLPASHEGGEKRHISDAQTLKILLSLATRARDVPVDELPLIVVEVLNPEYRALTEAANWPGDLQTVTGSEMVGRLMTQNLRQPGFSGIYNNLLSDTLGESIYVARARWARLSGLTVGEAVLATPEAVPIGRLLPRTEGHSGAERLRLMLLEDTIADDDEVVFIASGYNRIRAPRGGRKAVDLPAPQEPKAVSMRRLERECDAGEERPRACRLLVLGWSFQVAHILSEFSYYGDEPWDIHVVSRFDADELKDQVSEILQRAPHLNLQISHGIIERPGEIARIHPDDYDRVLILASERVVNQHLADARSIMVYAELERYWNRTGAPKPHVLIELNEEMNADIFEGKENVEMILSQEISSHLLAQVAIRRSLSWICEELFTSRGAGIVFLDLAELELDPQQAYHFPELQRCALARGYVLIGWQSRARRGRFSHGCVLVPGAEETFHPEKGDRLIAVVRYDPSATKAAPAEAASLLNG